MRENRTEGLVLPVSILCNVIVLMPTFSASSFNVKFRFFRSFLIMSPILPTIFSTPLQSQILFLVVY
jgi:hypothetical protein